MNKISMKAKLALIALFAVGLSGCASTQDMDSVKAMAVQAQQTAQQLQDQVKKAQDDAAAALAAAQKAEQKADDAQSCCTANTERMDRMFKKLQQK